METIELIKGKLNDALTLDYIDSLVYWDLINLLEKLKEEIES